MLKGFPNSGHGLALPPNQPYETIVQLRKARQMEGFYAGR
jgi:hypothetical protein